MYQQFSAVVYCITKFTPINHPQVTYSFGQLGTASLFNDIVPDPSDKPHLTSLTMTIDPSDVRTFAPVSSSSDAGHFLGDVC